MDERQTATTLVARAVNDAMDARGITQLALAEATGIAQATLSRRLRGVTPFTITELDYIAQHLGYALSDFTVAA